MEALRRWFLAHWFPGVFAIIGGLWVVTLVAYAAGADGITFASRYTGDDARIDFMREHERPYMGLADGVALGLDTGGPRVRGTIVRLEPGLPGIRWVCGESDSAGGI